MTSSSATGNRLYMYNGTSLIGVVGTFSTTANTATSLNLNASAFSLGDRINFRYTCDTTANDVQLSILWEYTRPI